MTRRFWALAIAATLTCGAAWAADKPNFTGNWKINNAKSDFGPMPQGPDKFERTVDHKDANLKVKTIQSMQGNERSTDVAYTIDGKEHDIQMGPATAKVTASWKDATLEIIAKRDIQGNAITSTEVWSLSADGKVLTVDSTISAPQGEFKLKFVLDKQ
ncbi:MAG TPA: hypothetical protein VGK29_14045 [Paludibaculum sp.]|jgi:hypothetical protein